MHTQSEIQRGEIYHIYSLDSYGSEQSGSRPGIIVSNGYNNRYSPTVEVVFLTTKHKKAIPTHVRISSAERPSIALCEQVMTVDKERLGFFIGCVTNDELDAINEALRISLAIPAQSVVHTSE